MSRVFLPLLGLLILTQCGKEAATESLITLEKHTYHQPMMGTRFSIVLFAGNKEKADTAAKSAFEYAEEVNRVCSDYDVTSELMQLNAAPANEPFRCSPILFQVLSKALDIAKKTDGAYDPTLGWHSYNWRMARKKEKLPTTEQIAKAKAASGWKKLILEPELRTATKRVDNMRLDLGGIAKGYAADGMLSILEKQNITHASIIAGGEVLLGDPPPGEDGWEVTLKTLDTKSEVLPKTLKKANCAISTSGDIHQFITIDGTRYSHIVNPNTGLGLIRRISATVVGSDATLTDALATAFCVNPQLPYPDIASKVIYNNNAESAGILYHLE
ncbi:MAG: FAD:protein FMN transferase [Akkermansiaceae bacterium]